MSQNALFKEGDLVAGPFGWCTHAISKGHGVTVLSNLGEFRPSYGLGVLGMPGYDLLILIYFGIIRSAIYNNTI